MGFPLRLVGGEAVAPSGRASVLGNDAKNPQPSFESISYGNGTDCACHGLCQSDADFGLLATLWPALPEPVEAGIVAMVKAAAEACTTGADDAEGRENERDIR